MPTPAMDDGQDGLSTHQPCLVAAVAAIILRVWPLLGLVPHISHPLLTLILIVSLFIALYGHNHQTNHQNIVETANKYQDLSSQHYHHHLISSQPSKSQSTRVTEL
jgi:membrane protein required for beta-lactamase induction